MKVYISAAVVAVVIIGILVFSQNNKTSQLEQATQTPQLKTYSNSELGLQFSYPEGYVLEERNGDGKNLLKTLVIMRAEDRANIPEGGEGAPAITIHAAKNAKKEFPLAWTEGNKQLSNINLKMGEVAEAVVGGANAIRYTADGLYASDNAVVAHGENVYVFSGAYLERGSLVHQDFSALLESVRFIPSPGQE